MELIELLFAKGDQRLIRDSLWLFIPTIGHKKLEQSYEELKDEKVEKLIEYACGISYLVAVELTIWFGTIAGIIICVTAPDIGSFLLRISIPFTLCVTFMATSGKNIDKANRILTKILENKNKENN